MTADMMGREDCAVLWSGRPMGDVRKDRMSSGIAGIDIFFSQNFAARLARGLCNSAFRLSLGNRALDQENIESRDDVTPLVRSKYVRSK